MKPRHIVIKPCDKKRKKPDNDFLLFVKKVERDEILINKCEIPKDGDMPYIRPWKL